PPPNNGAKPNIQVQGGPKVATGFIKFDLSTMPGCPSNCPLGSAVDRAILKVFADKIMTGGTVEVRQVTSAWNESTIDAGANFPSIQGTSVATISVPTTMVNDFLVADITPLVMTWLDTPSTNNGVALVPVGGVKVSFDSKEDKETGHEATLEISFVGSSGGTS